MNREDVVPFTIVLSVLLAIVGAIVYGCFLLTVFVTERGVASEQCCEPYPELGCANVEEHVCETEEEWMKGTIMCGEEAGAFTEMARMLGECEGELQMATSRAKAYEPTLAEMRARTEEVNAWLRSHAARAAIESCRNNTRSEQ